ncbi:hypothetical protein [Nonomuraea aurantiaca]|uniref:hypothetical protein n=1 Tax=Nonomuraea aurantiaca TaxID=2878562 RepID=UPI001CD92389|nr:hypothetical protein [Nonomuraea aurantiaca]MCA2224270.1 hypothetical protein [Nonomuraea aurantiaca]
MAEDKKLKVQKKTHMIKTSCPPLEVDDDGRSVAEVKNFVKSLDPTAVKQAGNAYLDACSTLAGAQKVIEQINVEMAKCWGGKASVEAQEALRVLHATVRELSDKLNWMGRPLQSLGERLVEHQEFMDKSGLAWSDNTFTFDDSSPGWYRTMDKGVEWGSQDELAGQHLRLLNDDLTLTYQQLPDSFHKEVPDIKDPAGVPPPVTPLNTDFSNPGGPGGPGGPGNGYNGYNDTGGYNGTGDNGGLGDNGRGIGSDGSNRNGVDTPTTPKFPNDTQTPDPTGNGTTDPTKGATVPGATDPTKGATDPTGGITDPTKGLTDPTKGMTDPTSGLTDPTKGLSAPTSTKLEDFQPPSDWNPTHTPTSTPNSNPTITSPNANFPSSPNSSSPSSGPLTSAGGSGGMASALPTTQAGLKAGTGNGMGMPFMPMGGAGGGTEERTNEGGTWLTEDDDVWGGETDGVVSDRIG